VVTRLYKPGNRVYEDCEKNNLINETKEVCEVTHTKHSNHMIMMVMASGVHQQLITRYHISFTLDTLRHAVTTFDHLTLVVCSVSAVCAKCKQNLAIRSWVITISIFKIWGPFAILDLSESGFLQFYGLRGLSAPPPNFSEVRQSAVEFSMTKQILSARFITVIFFPG